MAYYIMWAGAQTPGERTRRLEGGRWGGLEAGAFEDGIKLKPAPTVPIEIDTFEKDTGDMPPVFVVPSLVVRKDFAQALKDSGVTNVDYYPAVIHDRKRG